MAFGCFSACCSVDASRRAANLAPPPGKEAPKTNLASPKEDSRASRVSAGASGDGGEQGEPGAFQAPAAGGRRRESRQVARTVGGKEGPPEATPEPRSDVADGVLAAAEALVREVRTLDGVFGAAACEIGFIGVSAPAKPPKRNPAIVEPEFEEKKFESSATGDIQAARAKLEQEEGVGVACRKDNFFLCDTQRFRLCGVADGHGEFGHWVSHVAARAMLRLLLLELADADDLPQDDTVAQMFDTLHNAIKYDADWEGYDVTLSGTTLSVAIVDRKTKQVLVAWTGDSRCLCAKIAPGAGRSVELIASTADHKPQDPEERRRIIGSGGEVVRLQNDLPHRVFCRGKEAPGLAMSRALGDLMAHTAGVNHVPSFRRFALEADAVLLVCSDGVWEFIKNQEAARPVLTMGPAKVGEAVQLLAREARNRWLKEEGNVTDDITAIAIWGAPPPKG